MRLSMEEKPDYQSETERKIFEAARSEFFRKGLEGARMQEIADKARINKSMLHYYYKSKDVLFQKVYQLSIIKVIPQLIELLNEDYSLEPKIRRFVLRYIEIIQDNPEIPLFIVHELNKNPNRLKKFIAGQVGKKIQPFLEQLEQARKEGKAADMPADQLFVNMVSVTVFPFIGRPIFQMILEYDDREYEKFIEERRMLLPEYVVQTILKK